MKYEEHYSIAKYYKQKSEALNKIITIKKIKQKPRKHKRYNLKWPKIKSTNSPIEERLYHAIIKKNLYPELQYKILNYKVDFCFPDAKLVIECDGSKWHKNNGTLWLRQDYEARRHYLIKKEGYAILRYTGKEIHHNSDMIALRIKHSYLIRKLKLTEVSKPKEPNTSSQVATGHNIGNGPISALNGTQHGNLYRNAALSNPVDVMHNTRSREPNRTTGKGTIVDAKIPFRPGDFLTPGYVRIDLARGVKSNKEIEAYKQSLALRRSQYSI